MGAAAAPLAAGAAIGGMALSATASIEAGTATSNADTYKAETLDRAARVGQVQALQVGAQQTQKLVNTLGNIDAARAAAHDDPTSPTGAAVRDYTEGLGNTQKSISVDNILEQSSQDTSDAAYMRSAAGYAMLGGELNAASGVLKGLGSLGGSMGGGGGGS